MSLRQLSTRCLNGVLRQVSSAAASTEQGLQQQCGKHNAVFQQLVSGMRADAQRHYSQVFQPSRLYPKQHTTAEAYAFWGLIGLNVATTVAAKVGPPEVQQAILQHCRASVEAVADGRLYTLLTSSVCHTSAVHCAMNLLMLVMYRRVQPLTAREVSEAWHVRSAVLQPAQLQHALVVLPSQHVQAALLIMRSKMPLEFAAFAGAAQPLLQLYTHQMRFLKHCYVRQLPRAIKHDYCCVCLRCSCWCCMCWAALWPAAHTWPGAGGTHQVGRRAAGNSAAAAGVTKLCLV